MLPFDICGHEQTQTRVAAQMLQRFESDIFHWADTANGKAVPKFAAMLDADVDDFITDPSPAVSERLAAAQKRLQALLEQLSEQRDSDSLSVQCVARGGGRARRFVLFALSALRGNDRTELLATD